MLPKRSVLGRCGWTRTHSIKMPLLVFLDAVRTEARRQDERLMVFCRPDQLLNDSRQRGREDVKGRAGLVKVGSDGGGA